MYSDFFGRPSGKIGSVVSHDAHKNKNRRRLEINWVDSASRRAFDLTGENSFGKIFRREEYFPHLAGLGFSGTAVRTLGVSIPAKWIDPVLRANSSSDDSLTFGTVGWSGAASAHSIHDSANCRRAQTFLIIILLKNRFFESSKYLILHVKSSELDQKMGGGQRLLIFSFQKRWSEHLISRICCCWNKYWWGGRIRRPKEAGAQSPKDPWRTGKLSFKSHKVKCDSNVMNPFGGGDCQKCREYNPCF